MRKKNHSITGLILAGGRARRMEGQDKGLIKLLGKPMIAYSIDALQTQLENIIINANRNQDHYRQYAEHVMADDISGYHGPLAGVATALKRIDTELLMTIPCDSPFLPCDLVSRLAKPFINGNIDISVAHNGERIQPVFSLLRKSLSHSLDAYLASSERRIDRWFEQHAVQPVDFSDVPDTFDNINTPDDLKRAEIRLR